MFTNHLFYALNFVFLFVTACAPAKPAFIDNGNPGQIKVVVFYDNNQNGVMDTSEGGAQVKLGVSQDISCPPGNQEKITSIMPDINGVGVFENLKPGRYCVLPFSNGIPMTTKMTQEVYLSSDQELVVMFGMLKP